MDARISSTLQTIRQRRRWQSALKGASAGLVFSAAIGLVLGLCRWLQLGEISASAWVGLLLTGPLVGAVAGLVRRQSWHAAARVIDAHYELKDRTLTALEFVESHGDSSVWRDLQIDDAVKHLDAVDAGQVVPFRLPQLMPYSAAALLLAVALLVRPQAMPLEAAALPAIPGILAVADQIEEDVQEIEEIAADDELTQFVEELRKYIEEMKRPEVDVREALAEISEMQAAIAAQQGEFDVALVDGTLKELAGAFQTVDGLKQSGAKLEELELEAAAESLEKLEELNLDPQAVEGLSEQLKAAAKSMSESGMERMSQAVSEMAESAAEQDPNKLDESAKSIAAEIRKHDARKKLSEMLAGKLRTLEELKSVCQACQGQCRMCGGNCKAGNCQNGSPKNSMAAGETKQKAVAPSKVFGMAKAGNVDGSATQIVSQRQLEEITGHAGEGPSEYETTTSPEGPEEDAQRAYRDVYQKYRKMSEAVLESEPIPLGHRQTIRRYLELIRPQGDAEADAAK